MLEPRGPVPLCSPYPAISTDLALEQNSPVTPTCPKCGSHNHELMNCEILETTVVMKWCCLMCGKFFKTTEPRAWGKGKEMRDGN